LIGARLCVADALGHVLDAVDDEGEVAVVVEHRLRERAEGPLIEAAIGSRDVVLLHGQHFGRTRAAHALQRRAHDPYATRVWSALFVGEHLEDGAPYDRFATRHRQAEVLVGRIDDREMRRVRGEKDQRARQRREDPADLRARSGALTAPHDTRELRQRRSRARRRTRAARRGHDEAPGRSTTLIGSSPQHSV